MGCIKTGKKEAKSCKKKGGAAIKETFKDKCSVPVVLNLCETAAQ
jgi:hypothetical protein